MKAIFITASSKLGGREMVVSSALAGPEVVGAFCPIASRISSMAPSMARSVPGGNGTKADCADGRRPPGAVSTDPEADAGEGGLRPWIKLDSGWG